MEEKKKQLGELEADLVDSVDSYVKLVNEHKPKGTSNISRTGLIRSYFKELLSNKVLTKDFIELEHYYYFNKMDLLENGTVKAVPEEPSSDFEKCFTVKKVCNNLDSFDSGTNSYCYRDNYNRHKGIFIYYVTDEDKMEAIPLVFDFNDNELTISLIDLPSIELLINNEEDVETIRKLKEKHYSIIERYERLLVKPEGVEASNFYKEYIELNTSVLEDYKGRKGIDLLVKYNVDVLGVSSEDSSLADVNLNNPIEDLVSFNVAKDKELKVVNERYVRPLKQIEKTMVDMGIDKIIDKFELKDDNDNE